MCFAWKKHVDNHLYSMLLLKWAFYIAFVGNDSRLFAYCFFLFHQFVSKLFLSFIWTKLYLMMKNNVRKLAPFNARLNIIYELGT